MERRRSASGAYGRDEEADSGRETRDRSERGAARKGSAVPVWQGGLRDGGHFQTSAEATYGSAFPVREARDQVEIVMAWNTRMT